MKKREAEFGILFRHWVSAHPDKFPYGAVFELKQATTSLSFDAVQEHQIDALRAASYGKKGLLYKIPDDSRGIKPFDMVFAHNTPAYVVIRFPDSFEIIPVDTFVFEKERSKRKSLTPERAREISTISVRC